VCLLMMMLMLLLLLLLLLLPNPSANTPRRGPDTSARMKECNPLACMHMMQLKLAGLLPKQRALVHACYCMQLQLMQLQVLQGHLSHTSHPSQTVQRGQMMKGQMLGMLVHWHMFGRLVHVCSWVRLLLLPTTAMGWLLLLLLLLL